MLGVMKMVHSPVTISLKPSGQVILYRRCQQISRTIRMLYHAAVVPWGLLVGQVSAGEILLWVLVSLSAAASGLAEALLAQESARKQTS